jgi:hypothetical protein
MKKFIINDTCSLEVYISFDDNEDVHLLNEVFNMPNSKIHVQLYQYGSNKEQVIQAAYDMFDQKYAEKVFSKIMPLKKGEPNAHYQASSN